MSDSDEPKLAAPGAGLPAAEHFIAKLSFGLLVKTGSRASFDTRFVRERAAIETLFRSCDEPRGAKRVLIRRPRGMEDSSRYWSVWMTLDHLRIVNQAIERVIGALGQGIVPGEQASTAAVKPDPAVTAAIIPAYETSCNDLQTVVAAVADLNTAVRYTHPWFGPLNAAGWHALAGVHMGIHRVQIERILRGLPNSHA